MFWLISIDSELTGLHNYKILDVLQLFTKEYRENNKTKKLKIMYNNDLKHDYCI